MNIRDEIHLWVLQVCQYRALALNREAVEMCRKAGIPVRLPRECMTDRPAPREAISPHMHKLCDWTFGRN